MKDKKLSGAFGFLTQDLEQGEPAKRYDEAQAKEDKAAKPAVKEAGTNKQVSKNPPPAPKPKPQAEKKPKGAQLVELDPARIVSWKYKDRQLDDLKDLDFEELMRSIATEGQHTPIRVRPFKHKDYDYEEIFGFRRLNACRALGIKVLALVEDIDDQKGFIVQIKENDDRTEPSFWRRAVVFKRVMDDKVFPTIEALSVQARMGRSTISNYIRVAESMPDIIADKVPLQNCRRDVLFFFIGLKNDDQDIIKNWLSQYPEWIYASNIQLKDVKKSYERFIKSNAVKEESKPKKEDGPKTYVGKAGKLFSINRRGETVTVNILKDGKRIMSDSELGEALLKIMEEKGGA